MTINNASLIISKLILWSMVPIILAHGIWSMILVWLWAKLYMEVS
jgi:hypothetical protein